MHIVSLCAVSLCKNCQCSTSKPLKNKQKPCLKSTQWMSYNGIFGTSSKWVGGQGLPKTPRISPQGLWFILHVSKANPSRSFSNILYAIKMWFLVVTCNTIKSKPLLWFSHIRQMSSVFTCFSIYSFMELTSI